MIGIPTKVLSGVSGSLPTGERWIVTSGKLYVERWLVGVRMRRCVEGFDGFMGEPPLPAPDLGLRAPTIQQLVGELVAYFDQHNPGARREILDAARDLGSYLVNEAQQ